MALEDAVSEAAPAEITTRGSLAGVEALLDRDYDFAFLDIEVTDGRTFDIARKLDAKFVPFAFVSGLDRQQVPLEVRGAPFIAKPYMRKEIATVLEHAKRRV